MAGEMTGRILIFISFILLNVALVQSAALGLELRGLRWGSRGACQRSREDCPKDTVIVSQTDKRADFSSVQAAIESLPKDDSHQTILILAGDYVEQVNVTRAGPITLLGQTDDITDASKNKVSISWAAANQDWSYPDNVYTSALIVAPTLDASLTGAGPTGFAVPEDTPFGNRDFRAYNIDFRNTFSDYSDGPAHAISFSRANGGFYYCGFYSYQDTVCLSLSLLTPESKRP